MVDGRRERPFAQHSSSVDVFFAEDLVRMTDGIDLETFKTLLSVNSLLLVFLGGAL